MKSSEGGAALNKAEISTSAGGFENAPLSSFEFTNPGQKIEFVTQEVQSEIAGDLKTIESKAGPDSTEVAAATAAGKKFEAGVIEAGKMAAKDLVMENDEELFVPYHVDKTEKEVSDPLPQDKAEVPVEEISPEKIEEELLDVLPEKEEKNILVEEPQPRQERSADIVSIADLAQELPAENLERSEDDVSLLAEAQQEIPRRKGLFGGAMGSFIDASRERLSRAFDPSRIKKLNAESTIFAEKFNTLQTAHDSLETQKKGIESRISQYRERMKGTTAGDQSRAGEAIIRLRKQQAGIEGQQQKLQSKMETQKANTAKFEARRSGIADRVSKRFAERITPLEIKIGGLEREVVRINETLEKNAQAIEGYKNRLKDFEGNKQLQKIYKDEFRACEKQLKDLKFSHGVLQRRLVHINEGLVGVREKKKGIESLKDRTLNAGKMTQAATTAKK